MAFCSVPWFEIGLCSLGWPQTCYMAEDDLELTLFLPLHPTLGLQDRLYSHTVQGVGTGCTPLIPPFGKSRQVDLCEFEASFLSAGQAQRQAVIWSSLANHPNSELLRSRLRRERLSQKNKVERDWGKHLKSTSGLHKQAFTCAHTGIHIHIYYNTQTHIHGIVGLCIDIYISAYIHVCIYVCMYVCMYVEHSMDTINNKR